MSRGLKRLHCSSKSSVRHVDNRGKGSYMSWESLELKVRNTWALWVTESTLPGTFGCLGCSYKNVIGLRTQACFLEACSSWPWEITLTICLETYRQYSPSLSSYFLEGQQAKPRGSRERRAPHSDQGVGVPQIYNQKLRGEDSLFSFTGPSNLLWRTHLLSILLLRNPLFHDLSLSFILSIH